MKRPFRTGTGKKVVLSWMASHLPSYFRGFKKDCPDGQLHKEKVLEMYKMILPEGNAVIFVDQIFRIFDEDANGSIDFKVKIVNHG